MDFDEANMRSSAPSFDSSFDGEAENVGKTCLRKDRKTSDISAASQGKNHEIPYKNVQY